MYQALAKFDRELDMVRQKKPDLLKNAEAQARIRQMKEAKAAFADRQMAVKQLQDVLTMATNMTSEIINQWRDGQ